MAITIRPARPEDVGAIFRIRTSVVENHLSHAALAAKGITPDAVRAMIAEMAADAPAAWLAVDVEDGNEDGGRALGFAMTDPEDGSVFALFVLPEAEGRGAGRALLAAAEAQLFRDHARIFLETGDRTRAAAFYRRNGWVLAAELGQGDIRLEKCRPSC